MSKQLKNLENRLAALPAMAVAFSGGVDSTFLLAVAKKSNPEKIVAITVASPFVPRQEIELAKKMAESIGVEHLVFSVDILENKDVAKNDKNRCYYCKLQAFSLIKNTAQKLGIQHFLHAVNLDDLKDYRPGLKAAKELGFISPLADAEFTKSDIRLASKQLGLETWDKPSQSCLATRIPYGTRLIAEDLERIDAAERVLQALGFGQVRVRCHEKMARIEVVPDQMDKIMDKNIRQKISSEFKQLGFVYTGIDIDGYKTGKMNNEILTG